jgi:DNA-binding winged helix-turn-helix (wHTH) protein
MTAALVPEATMRLPSTETASTKRLAGSPVQIFPLKMIRFATTSAAPNTGPEIITRLYDGSVRVSFGDFVVDSSARQILRDATPVHLTGKAFQLLTLLIAERPSVVTKKEIYDVIWPNVFVQEANIKNLVAELRGAMGDDGEAIIRTERGVGYAFAADARDEPAARSPRFVLVVNGVAFALRDGRNVIGREARAQIRLESSAVSRSHATVTVNGDEAVLQDLGSRNGTHLNGEKLEAARPLHEGDEIRIAQFAIRFQAAPGTLRPTAPLDYRL